MILLKILRNIINIQIYYFVINLKLCKYNINKSLNLLKRLMQTFNWILLVLIKVAFSLLKSLKLFTKIFLI